MFGLGIPELIIIVLAFGILFFGSKKVTDFAQSMGRFTGEFKKGKQDIEREIREAQEGVMKDSTSTSTSASASAATVVKK